MDGAKEKRSLTDHFERAWSQALLAVSTAEDEAARVIQRFAGVAGWSQDEVKRRAREFGERLASQRREMERSVEESVKKALGPLKLPKREEIQELEARIDRLVARVDAQLTAGAPDPVKRH